MRMVAARAARCELRRKLLTVVAADKAVSVLVLMARGTREDGSGGAQDTMAVLEGSRHKNTVHMQQ